MKAEMRWAWAAVAGIVYKSQNRWPHSLAFELLRRMPYSTASLFIYFFNLSGSPWGGGRPLSSQHTAQLWVCFRLCGAGRVKNSRFSPAHGNMVVVAKIRHLAFAVVKERKSMLSDRFSSCLFSRRRQWWQGTTNSAKLIVSRRSGKA